MPDLTTIALIIGITVGVVEILKSTADIFKRPASDDLRQIMRELLEEKMRRDLE